MSQDALKQRLKDAINNILTDSGINLSNLPPATQTQIQNGIEREAAKKSEQLFAYLTDYVYDRLDAIEGRVQNVEQRLTSIDNNDPRNTTQGS